MAKSCAPSHFFPLNSIYKWSCMHRQIWASAIFRFEHLFWCCGCCGCCCCCNWAEHISHYKFVFKLWSADSISLKCWLIDKTMGPLCVWECVLRLDFFPNIFCWVRVASALAFTKNTHECRAMVEKLNIDEFWMSCLCVCVCEFILWFICSDGLF